MITNSFRPDALKARKIERIAYDVICLVSGPYRIESYVYYEGQYEPLRTYIGGAFNSREDAEFTIEMIHSMGKHPDWTSYVISGMLSRKMTYEEVKMEFALEKLGS